MSYLTLFLPWEHWDTDPTDYIVEVMGMNWLAKAAAAKATATGRETEVIADTFAEKFPALFAFMAAHNDGEKPRELCKLQVFADSGVWKAALHDANTEHSLFVTLGGPLDAFKALEKALTSDSPDWRSWGRQSKKKGRG